MTIYKSRQVNLDKEPWVSVNHGGRGATALVYDDMKYAPRPEFEPTRDPAPWLIVLGPWKNTRVDRQVPESEWKPRREQFDTPVNRVLEAFRNRVERYGTVAADWLDPSGQYIGEGIGDGYATPEEIENAKKVLTRLAGAA